MKIGDGSGKGIEAKVGSDNRLWVEAISRSEQLQASSEGNSYQIGTGLMTLTSANESAVLLLVNNEDRAMKITAVNATSSAMTGSSANVYLIKVYRKGTALSAGVASAAGNNNFGSTKSLDATIETGGEAQTITDGVAAGGFYIPNDTFFHTELAWTLPKGSSMSITVTPGASNTSMPLSIVFEGHLEKET